MHFAIFKRFSCLHIEFLETEWLSGVRKFGVPDQCPSSIELRYLSSTLSAHASMKAFETLIELITKQPPQWFLEALQKSYNRQTFLWTVPSKTMFVRSERSGCQRESIPLLKQENEEGHPCRSLRRGCANLENSKSFVHQKRFWKSRNYTWHRRWCISDIRHQWRRNK